MWSLEQLSQMVKDHLAFTEVNAQHSHKWIIGESPLGGRGIIATEDLPSGEILFVDRPLFEGPRSTKTIQRGCTVCCTLTSVSFFKCSKCALLLCSEQCQNTTRHSDDCNVISHWKPKVPVEEIDDDLMSRTLTAVRALTLDEKQKQFLSSMHAHMLPQHGTEIKELSQYFEIPEEEENLALFACCVLDTNAYQIAIPYGQRQMSRRGLFPVAALLNHNCIPNVQLIHDNYSQIIVKTVMPVRAGSEINCCYTGLLWGTPTRQTYLYKTKHFLCKCYRCADPSERGTYLAALKCFAATCQGSMLPIEPLKSNTSWRCLDCGLRVPSSNVCTVQNALGSMMAILDFENVSELENFLLKRVNKFIPMTNQIIVDLQCRLIWALGDSEGYLWKDLSENRLSLKENLCRGTLRTLEALGAGDAHLRGLLLYHLHATLAERARRQPPLYESLKSEIESTIEEAYHILQGSVSAPFDVELRRRYLGPGCDKSQDERFLILNS